MMSSPTTHLRKVAFAALLMLFALPVQAQERQAIITELTGTVELSRSGSSNFGSAEWGTPLFSGDRIRTASGSQAVLLFSDNNLMTVTGGNTYTVGGQAGGGRAVSSAVISSDTDLTLHRAGQGEIEVLGGLRNSGERQPVTLIGPVRTRVMASGPVFSWVSQDEYELYRVTLRTTGGDVWSIETTETEVAYPADAPALTPGETYFWKVEAEDMLDVVESELASFRIMDTETEASLKTGLAELDGLTPASERGASFQFLLGNLYASHGAYDQAIAAFETIAASYPGAVSVHRILASLYSETGNTAKALKALEKAGAASNDDQ